MSNTMPEVTTGGTGTAAAGCGICGAVPARNVILQGFVGLIVFLSVKSYKGMACRQCGIAMGRDLNARSMALGWWSIMAPVAVPLGLLANVLRMRGLSRLAEPHGAVAGMSAPLAIGRPAWQRPGPMIVTAIMGPLWALVVVLIVSAFVG
jgi:hypothetical protein